MATRSVHYVSGYRGRGLITNVGFGVPIIAVGAFGFINDILSHQVAIGTAAVGALLILVGLAINAIPVPFVRLIGRETKFTVRQPSMKPSFARILFSVPCFILSVYVIGFTTLPYIWAFIPFVIGAYFYFRGVVKFWINQHTIYFVTNRRRVVYVYRFLGLTTNEIRINTSTAVGQKKNIFEMITGRGNILVSNGPASIHQVHWQEIDDPGPVVGLLKRHAEEAANDGRGGRR